MEYKPTIGLEIHLQLATKSKMFCDCPNVSLEERANINICPICLGQPGSLPTLNQKAVEMILKLGLALNGEIEKKFYFERKNYFYPDLPKGYQISQKRAPIIRNAYLNLGEKRIRIQEMHLEEDTAKIFHGPNEELIDFNRAGVPLLEIVTTPEIESGREAKHVCEELQRIIRSLGISGANMEKGEMRCEVNISLNGGRRVEIKNLNSFRAVERAIDFETKRQARLIEEKKEISQETRGWDEKENKTISQRSKEESEDYRYFSEPDLPSFVISEQEIKEIKKTLPELPAEKRKRFVEEFGFNSAYAKLLTESKELISFTEQVMMTIQEKIKEKFDDEQEIQTNTHKAAKKVGDWISRLFGLDSETGKKFLDKITADNFANFISLILEGIISSNKLAHDVLKKMYETGGLAEDILEQEKEGIIDSKDEIKKAVDLVLENYPEVVVEYKKGKKTAIKYLLGQAMVATHGKANPKEIEKMLLDFLEK